MHCVDSMRCNVLDFLTVHYLLSVEWRNNGLSTHTNTHTQRRRVSGANNVHILSPFTCKIDHTDELNGNVTTISHTLSTAMQFRNYIWVCKVTTRKLLNGAKRLQQQIKWNLTFLSSLDGNVSQQANVSVCKVKCSENNELISRAKSTNLIKFVVKTLLLAWRVIEIVLLFFFVSPTLEQSTLENGVIKSLSFDEARRPSSSN